MSLGKLHMGLVESAGCALGNRGLHECESNPNPSAKRGPAVHHIASGSGKRSPFATVCLCWGAHQGPGGLHGMGTRAFIRLFRPPGDTEYGLLVWANEDIARVRGAQR